MNVALPTLFAIVAALAIGLVLLNLWRSLRAVLGLLPEPSLTTLISDQRSRLLSRRTALLRSIADLEFERQVGKISDKDFRRLDGTLRLEWREVLGQMDADLEPYLADAKRMIDERIQRLQKAATPARKTCGDCSAENDPDAAFCKKCGVRFGAQRA
jgi:hypothetical protein